MQEQSTPSQLYGQEDMNVGWKVYRPVKWKMKEG
jgi:hypothetical protein